MTSVLSIKRLRYAQRNGFFSNLSKRILVLGCPEPEALEILELDGLLVCHPEKSVVQKAKALNFQALVDLENSNKISILRSICATLVWVTKSRRETFFNIALAFVITENTGKIILTGEKKDGVEYAIKKLRTMIEPVSIISKSHGKIVLFKRPLCLPKTLRSWKKKGDLQKNASGFFSAPGIFSEVAIDKGSQLLAEHFSGKLHGNVIDLGAGWGYLSAEALKNSPTIKLMALVDSNLRALKSAQANITSPKTKFFWLDLKTDVLTFKNFDHVIMNPPFHTGRKVNFGLGLTFLGIANQILRKGGILWMVFNRELPYEKSIASLFSNYDLINQTKNYKIIKAIKT